METLLVLILFLLAVFSFVRRFLNSFSATKKNSCPGCGGGCQVANIEEKLQEATGDN